MPSRRSRFISSASHTAVGRLLSTEKFRWGMLLCLLSFHSTIQAQTKATESASSKTALEVVLVGKPLRKSLVLTTTQPARLEAIENTPIHSKLAMYVEAVQVDIGDKVTKGQTLIKLRASEMDAELAQKQALLIQAEAELIQAKASNQAAEAAVGTAKSKVKQAEAGLSRAESELVRWQSEFERIKSLSASGSVNRQIVDETEQKLNAAKAYGGETRAAVEAAQASVKQAESEAVSSAAGITTAESRIKVAQANIAYMEAMRSYLTLQAPFDGVITERRVDPGHFVQPAVGNAAALLKISRHDTIRVFISVPENDAAYLDLEDPVSIDIPALRGAAIFGKVGRTSNVIDPAHRSLETIVDLDNSNSKIRPGMFGTATIQLQSQPDALTLPAAAVFCQGKEAFCFRYLEGKASKTPIKLGIKVAEEFEIIEGMSETDSIILNKVAQLKDGQAVNLLPSAK